MGYRKNRIRIGVVILFLVVVLIATLSRLDSSKPIIKEEINRPNLLDRSIFLESLNIPTHREKNTYRGNVEVDINRHQLKGSVEVRLRNQTDYALNEVYFHLYPNQFKYDDALQGPVWDYVLGKEKQRKPGSIEIESVTVDGQEQSFQVKNTILEVPIEDWEVDQEVTVKLDFILFFPQNNSRFSYDDHSVWLGNWLPTVAVYDQEGWNLDPYYPIGDPFYSDMSNYDMTVNLPNGYQLSSTGVEADQEIVTKGDRSIYRVKAENVRDFAMVLMDQTYKVLQTKSNDLVVNTWYRSTDNVQVVEKLHKIGIDSLNYFSKTFGDYPYEEYDIIRTGGFFGGMEYPGLVFIQGSYFEKEDLEGYSAVAHETAHQWWYGMVGNDEVEEPWVDESLTEYSTLRFLLDEYPDLGVKLLASKKKLLHYAVNFEQDKEYLGNSVQNFSDWDSYGILVYIKGPFMFYKLEQLIGVEKMKTILHNYFDRYQYNNVHGEDLISFFEWWVGDGVRPFFDSWLKTGMNDYLGEK